MTKEEKIIGFNDQITVSKKESRTRDNSIDILRFLALTGIILVHISPGPFWSQLRNFDVPMMVFLSGTCFSYIPSNNFSSGYLSYIFKRFKRLILPTWIFLLFYLLLHSYVTNQTLTVNEVVSLFSLTTGWYTWIIRVFFCIAVLSPLLYLLTVRVRGKNLWFLLMSFIIINEVLGYYARGNTIATIGIMTLGYSIVFCIGITLPKLNRRSIIYFGLCDILIFSIIGGGIWALTGNFTPTQEFKYPPMLYYLSYAFTFIAFLWYYRQGILNILRYIGVLRFCIYIGRHTLWIYLWHIIYIALMTGRFNAQIRFIMVYSLALLTAYLQERIVTFICEKFIGNNYFSRELKNIFCQ